jgi:hypothetical protein
LTLRPFFKQGNRFFTTLYKRSLSFKRRVLQLLPSLYRSLVKEIMEAFPLLADVLMHSATLIVHFVQRIPSRWIGRTIRRWSRHRAWGPPLRRRPSGLGPLAQLVRVERF